MEEHSIFSVGYHKGEMDFGINYSIRELTYEQMKEFRKMLVVGIGQAEQMWRSSQEAKSPTAQSSESTRTTTYSPN